MQQNWPYNVIPEYIVLSRFVRGLVQSIHKTPALNGNIEEEEEEEDGGSGSGSGSSSNSSSSNSRAQQLGRRNYNAAGSRRKKANET
ncbi:hypothetical protein M0802_000182 [Mischocyttarus mexicanus]|nr:hypothetical protein M0802_000182 [Mischocyttarus mexicanus]